METLVQQLALEGLKKSYECGAGHDFWKFLSENRFVYGDFVYIHFCNSDPIDIQCKIKRIKEVNSENIYRMYIFKTNDGKRVNIRLIFSSEDDDNPDYNDGEKSFCQEFRQYVQKMLVTNKELKPQKNCYDLKESYEMKQMLKFNRESSSEDQIE